MTLENLLRIGRIKEHPADAAEIQKLLAAARRSLKDARVQEISLELRFDAAYNAIIQAALVAGRLSGQQVTRIEYQIDQKTRDVEPGSAMRLA